MTWALERCVACSSSGWRMHHIIRAVEKGGGAGRAISSGSKRGLIVEDSLNFDCSKYSEMHFKLIQRA